MPTITLDLPLDLVLAIASEGVETSTEFDEIIIRKLRSLYGAEQPPISYDREVAVALERCKALEKGASFTLNADHSGSRRLFSREEWKTLTANAQFRPTVFGRLFGKAITAQKLAEPCIKTSDNKQVYRRV